MSGKLSYVLELQDRLSATLDRARSSVATAKSDLGGAFDAIKARIAGAFTATAVYSFVRSIENYAGQIKDASDATGLSVERFQVLSLQARQNGVQIDRLTGFLMRLRDIQDSIGRDPAMQAVFARLGLSVKEVEAAQPDALLKRIADGLRSTGDASAAFDLFGRGAGRFLSTLNELSRFDWDGLRKNVGAGVFDESSIEMIDAASDKLAYYLQVAKLIGATPIIAPKAIADTKAFVEGIADGSADSQAKLDFWRRRRMQRDADAQADRAQKDARSAADTSGANALGVETAALDEQLMRARLSDKELEAVLQERVNKLSMDAVEQGLTLTERQRRHNEALKASIELLQVQKRVREDAAGADDQMKRSRSSMQDYKDMMARDREDALREEERRQRSIAAARDAISSASARRVYGAGLEDYFERVQSKERGRTPRDDAARESLENLRTIAENTKALQALGVVR
jgi:hypothetical protein